MKSWFTADHHFGHANIIRHCARPFASVDDMNEEMIRRWNSLVAASDFVYHLGDFSFRGASPEVYRHRLNGKIVFVIGNHDPERHKLEQLGIFESIHSLLQIKVNGETIVLCHYGMRVWNKSHHGTLHLYGHSHGTLPGDSQSLDVGVDCWEFRPVSLEQIKARMATLPKRRVVDHHGDRP